MKHRDTVFHVQTEDKGVETASVESLIYIGGRILARRMVTYKALLERGEGRDAVSRLMDKQHRMMISQIKGGGSTSRSSTGRRPRRARWRRRRRGRKPRCNCRWE
ncbi:MAG: hypothetical protein R2991_04045 [Thermoanaerobaculia bacterium]